MSCRHNDDTVHCELMLRTLHPPEPLNGVDGTHKKSIEGLIYGRTSTYITTTYVHVPSLPSFHAVTLEL